jgi:hypothetical protein
MNRMMTGCKVTKPSELQVPILLVDNSARCCRILKFTYWFQFKQKIIKLKLLTLLDFLGDYMILTKNGCRTAWIDFFYYVRKSHPTRARTWKGDAWSARLQMSHLTLQRNGTTGNHRPDKGKPLKEHIFRWQNLNFCRPLADESFLMKNSHFPSAPSSEWGGRGAATANRSQQLSSLTTALEPGSASPMPSKEGGRRRVAAQEEGGSSCHRSGSRWCPRRRRPVSCGWWHGGSTQP